MLFDILLMHILSAKGSGFPLLASGSGPVFRLPAPRSVSGSWHVAHGCVSRLCGSNTASVNMITFEETEPESSSPLGHVPPPPRGEIACLTVVLMIGELSPALVPEHGTIIMIATVRFPFVNREHGSVQAVRFFVSCEPVHTLV